MAVALLAQAAIHQMRQRLDEPFCHWDAAHLARDIFGALEGDVRVKDDTVLVTCNSQTKQAQEKVAKPVQTQVSSIISTEVIGYGK